MDRPERPRIRLNQLGYLIGRPMRATLVHGSTAPIEVVVRDSDGTVVCSTASTPWPQRPEPTSGLTVHTVEFTGLSVEGTGYRLEAAGLTSHPFAVGRRLYGALAADALRFFYVMRSGTPISAERAPGYSRPAGHESDRAVPAFTGPEGAPLYPDWHRTGTFDVHGGWYDAGDYGKYVTSGALAVWQLLDTLTLHEQPHLVEECRWQLDWLLRMRVPAGDPLEGMAFHKVHGTTWSPLPGLPHEDPTARALHRPSTGATLHVAAVTAQAARLLRDIDPPYAATLLAAAREAHAAAHRHPRLLAPDDHARFGGGPYGDDDLTDDFYWAAVELWLATGEERYRTELTRSPWHVADPFDPSGFDFDRVAAPAVLDLARATGPGSDDARERLRRAATRLHALQSGQPWGQPYAPEEGWAWGSNGRILNNLVVLAVAHLVDGDARHLDAVAGGMDYLFGRNALGQSYVTGHGTDTSRHQRTRQFGHDLDPALPPPPPGALAGGPNSIPPADFPYDPRLVGLPPQCCYLDEPTSEVTNDVCVRWNAPLVWIATFLDRI
jgi:endoglucanase